MLVPASVSGLTIVLAQVNLLVGDVAGNARLVIESALRARDEMGAHLIVFPELTLTGYPPEDLLLRDGLHQQVLEALEHVRQEVDGIYVLVGHPWQVTAGIYNAVSMFYGREITGRYFKQHLPNYSVFDEKRYFVPGSEPLVVKVNDIPVGITICEDLWMSGPIQQTVKAGAKLVINVNASPFRSGKICEREDIARERVRDAGVPLVYLNLVGGQDELVFDGQSFVMDREGEISSRTPAWSEGLYPVSFENGGVLEPVVADVVPVLEEEANVYQALVLGVRDYVQKNGFAGVVLGLSGGIDSALTLAVAVDALGADKVEAVMMPSRYTADMSLEDARQAAEALGVDYRVLPIETAFNAFLDILRDEFANTEADTTEQNIQARCRGLILMAISNKKGRMVLTTGNKSELAVGYATLYGDMAGGFAPIKDVPKTLVYRLSRYRNTVAPVIPERIIERPPSAELAPDQRDDDVLPPYDILDPILEAYVEQDKTVAEIVALGFEEAIVRQVVTLVNRNEYKRRQAPPGVRITRRAFGRDRRYPITSGYM